MSIGIWKLTLIPGGFVLHPVELQQPAESLAETSAVLPGGAYTTLRTYNRCQALRLQAHFLRLEETARHAGRDLRVPADALRGALAALAGDCNLSGTELRFRITLDLEAEPGQIYIAAEPLSVPAQADYERGVAVVTTDLQRIDPKAKLTRFLARAEKVRAVLPPGINEAVMVSPAGLVLEGLSSNFFGVLKGILYTAEEGVLSGITRSLALDAANALGIPKTLEALRRADLPELEEAFLTGTSRGLLPVRRIDDLQITAPGPLTQQLMSAFDARLKAELESLE